MLLAFVFRHLPPRRNRSFYNHPVNLNDHYNQLWERSLASFREGRFDCDPYLRGKEDRRYGLTLRAVPPRPVKADVVTALSDIQSVAPEQYYYPAADLHITLLSVISCYAGFTLGGISPGAYADIIQRAIENVAPFRIRFRGVTASPSCIMVQGFPEGDQLKRLRDALRRAFAASGLEHTIDQRYELQTAHMTVIRFRQPPDHARAFVEKVGVYRDHDFGDRMIDELELVGNDWYQRAEKVEMVRRFCLDSNGLQGGTV